MSTDNILSERYLSRVHHRKARFLVDHADDIKMSIGEVTRRRRSESNLSSLKSDVLRVLVTKTRERLEELYKISNDVWKEEEVELTPQFPVLVYSEEILPEIANARDFGNEVIRSIPFKDAAPLGLFGDYTESDWKEAQDWLRSTWKEKVEVDAEGIRQSLATRRSKSSRDRRPGKRRQQTMTLKKPKKPGGAWSRAGTDLKAHPLNSRPDVVKRRAIVHQNLKLSSKDLCAIFDLESVPLPDGWREDFSVQDWRNAYQVKECRRLIHKIVCVDKRKSQ